MIRQDDDRLNRISERPFKEYGCALFDVLYYGVMYGEYVFDRGLFLQSCWNWEMEGMISKTLSVNWNPMLEEVGLDYKIVIENGTHILPSTRRLKEDELQVLYLYNPDTKLHHFVCANKNDEITYDSLGKSVTGEAYNNKIGWIESKRIFKKK